ncbi:MAG: leucine-rich repeat protein [Bacteroidales bacterium]|nr:leucine-rich repeat protein [Bacteroidales bacterium]MCM1415939.1 leucine-rich repeat protein [bacterium]MCM1424144.1 leucine-rich repeat protein [bacterium]
MGKMIRKLIGTLLLVTAIVVTQIPVSGVEAEETETSATPEFQMDGTTLVKYNGTAENVYVSDQVERIEAEAFAGNDAVRHITVGDSVEVIGARAFSECLNLQSVTIPHSVEVIENAAFSGCPSLSEVSIGVGLKSLGNGAFAGDYSLASVDFDSSNPDFVCDDGAIYNKKGQDVLYQVLAGRKGSSYSMPVSVDKIRPYAFWGDYNLEDVIISSNVPEITGYAFSNCKNLKEVSIPYSVKTIDMKAFEDCVRLRQITIPISVSAIHATAFDGCTKLTINAEAGSYAKQFAESLVLEDIDVSEYEEAPIPGRESEEEDGEELFLGPVDYYHEVSHMNAMEAEEDDSRVKAKSRVVGQEVYVLVDNAKATVNVGSTGEILGGEPVVEEPDLDTIPGLAGSEDAKGGSFPKYTVVNGEIIAAQAYYDEDMTSCEIPSGIRRIGEFAYARAGLTSVRIPDGVEEIDYAAFYHCDELTDVVIPNSVKTIGVSAFDKTPWLSGWKANAGEAGDFLIVGDGILLAYRGNGGEVSIPASVKKIGPEAFRGLSKVTAVQIPDSVTEIGEGAFEDCDKLERIEGGEGLVKICDRAFAGCPVSSVYIGPRVEAIGLRAFDNEAIKNGVVYFAGTTLPARSYESAATKLYREDYRGPVFTGTRIAVIPAGVTDLTDTCLSSAGGAFTGVICKKKGEAPAADGDGEEAADAADGGTDAAGSEDTDDAGTSSEADANRAEALGDAGADRSGSSEETQAEITEEDGILTILKRSKDSALPGDKVEIGKTTYTLESAEPGAESLFDTVQRDASATGIEVVNNSYSISRDATMTAVMEGSEGSYRIAVEDSEDAKNRISEVYQSIYGGKLPHSLHAYEITMTDLATDVPITGLGKQRVEIRMPVPQGVLTENLHVVCLDQDGQLEEVDSRIISMDGQDAIAFTAAHFSAYGIYHYGSGPAVADVKDGQAVFASLGKKDDSPDTGDYSIHPKYFLGAGLFFAAMAVFFWRRKPTSK